jgi:hypothetical protein
MIRIKFSYIDSIFNKTGITRFAIEGRLSSMPPFSPALRAEPPPLRLHKKKPFDPGWSRTADWRLKLEDIRNRPCGMNQGRAMERRVPSSSGEYSSGFARFKFIRLTSGAARLHMNLGTPE